VASDQSPGKPQDALEELLRTAVKPIAAPAPDPDVALAFVTGWHAAEAIAADADAERSALAGTQVRADIARLGNRLQAAPQGGAAVTAAVQALAGAPESRRAAADSLRDILLATDFRLGKGFDLGRGIAGLFGRDGFAAEPFRDELVKKHDTLHDWLSQLATALPPNAGHSVKDSLDMWGQALAGRKDLRALEQDHVVRQGERWRTLLSGEKTGKDALEITDYVGVAEGMVAQIRGLAWNAVKGMWGYVLLVIALIALGVAGIVVAQHTAGSAAGIASILTALGLTWKGLGGSLGRAVARIEQPMWDAQVDRAIAYAISSPLPDALVADAPKHTLLAGLGEWRKDHKRPSDQGRRRSGGRGPQVPS
jgi:hypothetical protein